jgi:cytochrome c553
LAVKFTRRWRPLAFGLAAAALCVGAAGAQTVAERVRLCAACHGEDGNSRTPNVPSLAGQPEFFLVNQLFLFREGVRKVAGMSEVTKGLKDEDLVALAKHFTALEPKPSEEKVDPALVKRGAALAEPMRCASCHLPSLAGQEQMPRLAKQRIDYLIHSMKQFRDDARSGADTQMNNVLIGVSDDDIAALAHYAASR